ncbi:unnamed protein product, partial [Meganyctiphanes norvegica]
MRQQHQAAINGGPMAHHLGLRAHLSMPPSRIPCSHHDLLQDPLANLRTKGAAPRQERHAPLQTSRSLHGTFQARMSGPLANLQQTPAVHGAPDHRGVSAPRSRGNQQRSHSRPSKKSRVTRALSATAPLHQQQDKENLATPLDDEDEGFEDVWSPTSGREEASPRSMESGEATTARWAGDLTRLSSALDQLATLCHTTHGHPASPPRHQALHSSSSRHHTHSTNPSRQYLPPPRTPPLRRSHPDFAPIPLHNTHSASTPGDTGELLGEHQHAPLQESDSGLGTSAGGGLGSSPPSPLGCPGAGRDVTGVARRVGVALRALGGRLGVWGRGSGSSSSGVERGLELGSQATQISSAPSSASSSPLTIHRSR